MTIHGRCHLECRVTAYFLIVSREYAYHQGAQALIVIGLPNTYRWVVNSKDRGLVEFLEVWLIIKARPAALSPGNAHQKPVIGPTPRPRFIKAKLIIELAILRSWLIVSIRAVH